MNSIATKTTPKLLLQSANRWYKSQVEQRTTGFKSVSKFSVWRKKGKKGKKTVKEEYCLQTHSLM